MNTISTSRMYVRRCPEPTNIIWQNLSYSTIYKRLATAIIYFVCLMVLIPVYFIINLVRNQSDDLSDSEDNSAMMSFMTQLLISAMIVIINVIVEIYILMSTKYERHQTNTMNELSIVYKLSLLEFLNIGLIPLLGHGNEDEWFDSEGLVQEVAVVVIMMNISEIIRVIFHPQYIVHLFLQGMVWCRRNNLDITQKQANWIYETDEAHIAKTLSSLLIFCISILFYSPIVPGLIIFGIIGSIVMYFVLKIIITKRMSIKKSISSELLVQSVEIMKLGILSNAILSFIFFNKVFDTFSIPSLISLIMATFFFVLPVKKYLDKWTVRKVRRDIGGTYYDHQNNLGHYDLVNPVTKTMGISRLEGTTLRDQIKRGMIGKLQVISCLLTNRIKFMILE